jgi:hypothetical protein
VGVMTATTQSRNILKKRFPASGDDGRTYEIHVYVKTVPVNDTESDAPIEKIDSICLDDGTAVNVIAKGKYEVVQTGVKLTSTHPDAI